LAMPCVSNASLRHTYRAKSAGLSVTFKCPILTSKWDNRSQPDAVS
jgi:hypothetical protein